MRALTKNLIAPSKAIVKGSPNRLTRYAFYAFVFVFPWEAIEVGLGENLSLAKLIGFSFFGIALLQPKICFRFPPKAFWLFLLYFCLYALLTMIGDASYDRITMMRGFTIAQMLVLFWLSYNVMHDEKVLKGFLLAFIGACLSLIVVGWFVDGIFTGVRSGDIDSERMSVLGQNPGTTGATLALGLIALLGLVYGRQKYNLKTRLLVWLPFFIMAGFLVKTGSRAGIFSLALGIPFLLVKSGNLRAKIKLGLIVLIGLVALFGLARNTDIATRIGNTMSEGDTAGRDVIYIEALGMLNEKPLLGWGPVHYRFELARRVNYKGLERDAHNLILKILLEVGLVGAIPFFLGIGTCLWAAWKAKDGLQGALPLSMLVMLLLINMSQTWDNRKLFWFILAYALVSARYAYSRKTTKIAASSDKSRGVLVKTARKSGLPVVAGHSS